ncbi:MAG: glucosaminidase domain-containing protein, partial [Ferruginibacter sp.]
MYKDIAIREMKRMGIPAAISLAQGLLETENGNSDLVKKSNNHFGIKCKSSWTAGGVSHDDDAPGECFRTYKTADESYRDHSNFLRGGQRYSFLFDLDPTDYKGWAHGLKKAGYATNPKYPAILIKHIERYNLQQYSAAASGSVPRFEPGKYTDDAVVFEKDQTMQAGQQANITTPDTGGGTEVQGETALLSGEAPGDISFINGSKCLSAKKGTSLLAIASRYNISLHKLLDINELEEDGILEVDQLIFLQKKSREGDNDFIVVQKKETLYDVAQHNGILLGSLLEYNDLSEDGDVFPGTKLYLKAIAESTQASTTRDKAGNRTPMVYEVRPKDGLYTVAKKYSVT